LVVASWNDGAAVWHVQGPGSGGVCSPIPGAAAIIAYVGDLLL